MKHLVLLASIYALIVALVVPGSILAQDEPAPAVTETTQAEPAPAPAEPAPAEPTPAEAAPAPAEAAPAPTAAPEPQFLADERAEAPDPQPKAIAAASGSVTIADFSFTPGTITINQGDTVTWNNNGPTPHSAKANDGSFDTGILKKGQSGSHTFDKAGTFSYFCQPHPFMKATVVVKAASAGGGGTSGSGSADTGGTDDTSGGTSAGAAQSDGGPTLPDTGSDSGALLVLGGLMLVLGAAIHRRTAASDPRPAGRIGW
jgi:LPXTG-motif cell wall-anchored protein